MKFADKPFANDIPWMPPTTQHSSFTSATINNKKHFRYYSTSLSVLWRWWLGDRKGINLTVKNLLQQHPKALPRGIGLISKKVSWKNKKKHKNNISLVPGWLTTTTVTQTSRMALPGSESVQRSFDPYCWAGRVDTVLVRDPSTKSTVQQCLQHNCN